MPRPSIPSTEPTVRFQENDTQILTPEPRLIDTNIALWRELTDEVFERHFRQRYFGNESISRQQAIDRFVAMRGNKVPVGSIATQDTTRSIASTGDAEMPGDTSGSADIQIRTLPTGRLPWDSMLLSLFAHGLILALLLSVRLPKSGNRMIDFETETITYYKVSPFFPDVAPKESPHDLSNPKQKPVDFRTSQEVQIQPTSRSSTEIVIHQPNLRQMPALPKLLLPNLLLQSSKMDPGREPLIVSDDVLRQLSMDIQQPASLRKLPENSTHSLVTRQPALPLPQLAAPAEPVSGSLQVNQVASEHAGVQQRTAVLPYAAPPIADSPLGFEVEKMLARGPDILVFSASPSIPNGDIAVPKASSTGRFTGSAGQVDQPTLPAGAGELSRAEVVMPSISINNRTAPNMLGTSTAVVQTPPPKPPAVPVPSRPTNPSSLLDFLPSRIPSTQSLAATRSEVLSGESPLRDYENRGGPVYTAAINAPNFTSKRGSWIFRFAEHGAAPPLSGTDATVQLTAPSAIVKVDPKYTPEAVREKLEGVVVLFAVLRKDGTVDGESVRILRKLDSRLDESAREALLSWKFKPSRRNGIAVDIQMEVSIPFYFRREGL